MIKTDSKEHWDHIYDQKPTEQLGWYEASPQPSLDLIEKCSLSPDARILVVGAGTTTLIDALLDQGYTRLIATDISRIALEKLCQRIGETAGGKLTSVTDDLTHPEKLQHLPPVDCWHDRAVLHFFVDEQDRKTYFDLVRLLVKAGGYVVIAAFHLEGAPKCSGLPVYRYDEAMLADQLGEDFSLLESFLFDYQMPSGDLRKYVYSLFKRTP